MKNGLNWGGLMIGNGQNADERAAARCIKEIGKDNATVSDGKRFPSTRG